MITSNNTNNINPVTGFNIKKVREHESVNCYNCHQEERTFWGFCPINKKTYVWLTSWQENRLRNITFSETLKNVDFDLLTPNMRDFIQAAAREYD